MSQLMCLLCLSWYLLLFFFFFFFFFFRCLRTVGWLSPDIFLLVQIVFGSGWLIGFYGISTFVGYLTPNSVYMYVPFTNEYLVGKIFYKQDFTRLHMINQF